MKLTKLLRKDKIAIDTFGKTPLESQREKILSETTSFHMTEAYKNLRTSIIFSMKNSKGNILLVTSSNASEGKSINALNTAIAFAEANKNTCLIDCDLRKPNIAKLMNESSFPGISNVLVNLAELEDVVRKSKFSGLDVICSGDIPPNPTELLSSDKMAEILTKLRETYDYIVIDSPPLNVVTDALILSKLASGVLLIVRKDTTTKDEVKEVVEKLNFAGAKLIGTVLNGGTLNKKRYGKNDRYYYKYQYKEK